MKYTRLALAITLMPSIHAVAANDFGQALQLENTVITANREVQDKADVKAAVTVFTRDDINRLQPTNMADLLQRVPGVQVVQSGGRGSATSVYLRGTSGTQTLVLVDGVKITSASAGSASLQYININQVERVEVLRGSRSAIYGADAMGGVIQIFTKRGEQGLKPTIAYAVGNKGLQERYLGLSGGNDKTRFNLSTSLDDFSGFDRTYNSYPLNKDHDAYRNKAVSFNINHQLTENLTLGLVTLHQEGKTEYDDLYVSSKPYIDYVLSSNSAFVNWQVLENWSTRLEFSHAEDKQFSKNKLNTLASAFSTYRDTALWQNNLKLNEENALIFGVEYQKEKLRTTSVYNQYSRWNQAAFIQHSYKNNYFSTELGIRGDKNQQFGNHNSWNGAISVPITEKNQITFSYAEGFRAPTFNDLYFPDFCDSYGCYPSANPSLKNETSKSYEARWSSNFTDNMSLEVSLYRTDIKNAIILDSNFLPQNTPKARINGFETTLKHKFYDIDGVLAVSVIDPKNKATNKQLPRRAKRTLSYDLDKQLGAFGIGATWRLVSSSYNDAANKQPIAGYGTLDLRGSWQATDELGFDVKLANIFDKGYSRALYEYPSMTGSNYGYREDPFTIRLGMKWTPNL